MLGNTDAVVVGVKPFDLHGVTYYDLTLVLADESTHTARLGPEAVPEGLEAGDRVRVTIVANMVVAVSRP